MTQATESNQGTPATPKPTLTFKEMTPTQKSLHLLKVVVFFVTVGFAFPNVFEDF